MKGTHMKLSIPVLLFAVSAAASSMFLPAHAQKIDEPSLKVFDVWAKTTVPGGSVSAAYMHIKSAKPLRLVKAESAMAQTVEIHDMKMKDGVMEMKAIDAVDIPANKLVDLKPGGIHVMLIKVTKPIKKGDNVPLKLTFETADKKTFTRDVMAKGQEKDSGGHKH
jgi:periplasmic copper chaperone A